MAYALHAQLSFRSFFSNTIFPRQFFFSFTYLYLFFLFFSFGTGPGHAYVLCAVHHVRRTAQRVRETHTILLCIAIRFYNIFSVSFGFHHHRHNNDFSRFTCTTKKTRRTVQSQIFGRMKMLLTPYKHGDWRRIVSWDLRWLIIIISKLKANQWRCARECEWKKKEFSVCVCVLAPGSERQTTNEALRKNWEMDRAIDGGPETYSAACSVCIMHSCRSAQFKRFRRWAPRKWIGNVCTSIFMYCMFDGCLPRFLPHYKYVAYKVVVVVVCIGGDGGRVCLAAVPNFHPRANTVWNMDEQCDWRWFDVDKIHNRNNNNNNNKYPAHEFNQIKY